MASLPPTEAAAHQHSRRVYNQIQNWLGNKKRPEDWGWERTISGLQPVKTLKPPAPDSILLKIFCKCTKIQAINSDEDDDDEPIRLDDLVEASLSLHVEEDTDDLPKDIGP
ncbi:hypothetical protein AVEN_263474-1 [Araneus ventricosus]|uniref:Uncharacterized protein n=1 Tax=Araneus ventricosus TaxID=182803 RepID=A0A4Y2EXN5_ARAVE|nr:hypothetical protein AVEN_263474-1 [Araneus ventricosus]